MLTLNGVRSNPVCYALGAVEMLFKDKNDLVNTLDLRTANQDSRIRAAQGICLAH